MSEPRRSAWDTRRALYGAGGHRGYSTRRSPLEAAALRLIVRLHNEEMLSEGQCCRALDLDHVEFRELVDRFSGGNTIGGKIADARRAAGLTQEQVAEQVGVTRPQIANIEADRCDVTITRLLGIAAALGVPPETLLPSVARERSDTGHTNGDSGKPS